MNGLSIRWRIMLWNTAAFAVVLTGFGLVIFFLLRQTHYDHLDAQLGAEWNKLQVSMTNGDITAVQIQEWVQQVSNRSGFHAFVVTEGGAMVTPEKRWQAYSPLLPQSITTVAPRFDTLVTSEFGPARRLAIRTKLGGQSYQVVLLASLRHVNEELQDVVKAIGFTIPPTLLVAAVLSYLLARKSLSPVEQLRHRTNEITAEHLDRRLPVANPNDELGLLTSTINAMIDRLELSFREVQRFTGDASHELRTPLAIIRSEAEMGVEEKLGHEAAQDRFGSILEECGRLASMTDQLLVLCREDAGISHTNATTVDLANLVQEVVDALLPLAEARWVELKADLLPSALITGDSQRLRQVFYNLLDNAFKFTPAGGTVSIRMQQRPDAFLVEVRDSGSGISEEHLEKVFDRFYRVEKSSQQNPGAGLGLSIVKSIVEAHGGKIEVRSRRSVGTTFQLTFVAGNVH